MRGALAIAAFALGCGGGGTDSETAPPPSLPQAKLSRPATGGDPLLAFAPAGADVVLELDLARLRANEVVGPLYGELAARLPTRFAGLENADVVVLAGYEVGDPGAESLLIVRGGDAPAAATAIDDDTAAIGPPAILERLDALRAGHGDSMADDEVFMRLRDTAMPAKATAAALRLTAQLDFDARVGLANLFSADAVPAGVSVWGDVIDDLAVIALLSGEEADEGRALADALGQWRSRVARDPTTRAWGMSSVFDLVEIDHEGALARVIFIVGPSTLDRVVRRLDRRLSGVE